MKRVCIVPRVSGVGGMVSFRAKFSAGLEARGIEVVHDPGLSNFDSLLVIGGTRDIPGLWRAKRRGVRIVQRLNGMNWLHHLQPTGIKHYLRAEYGNLILRTIRARLADHIVYQSRFAQGWWERAFGPTRVSASVIHNAVDLNTYTPAAPDSKNQTSPSYELPTDHFRLLLVEGSLMGGYELGLESAVQLIVLLNSGYLDRLGKSTKLMVAGRISDEIKNQWSRKAKGALVWAGLVAPEQIPALDRSAHLLYSSDINAACPNSVIEALACGLPVLAFDTGALPELVTGNAGRVVPYGGNPWQLEQPDIPALAEAAVEILSEQSRFRTAARQHAEESFDLDQMVDRYLDALKG
ncbi:MAG: glycosyltransferase family 4 protein [Anaerolineales bacterium]